MVEFKQTLSNFLTVKTVKLVEIRHWKLALFNYLVLIGILVYVIAAQIVIKKGYQKSDTLTGEVNVKIKGSASTIVNGQYVNWDEFDAVYPFKEENSFFITTGYQITPKQTRSQCTVANKDLKCSMSNNDTCVAGAISASAAYSGVQTGDCTDSGYCQLYSWCPIEVDKSNPRLLNGTKNFTAFVKASARFSQFDVNLSNVKDRMNNDTNFFSINQTLSDCQPNEKRTLTCANVTYDDIARTGALIIGFINWDYCDLDRGYEECEPRVSFYRVDYDVKRNYTFSTGYNFRYTKTFGKYDENTKQWTEYRDLYKVYGIRYVFLVGGRGGRFDFAALGTSLGSGLALLGLATVLTDLLVLHIAPHRQNYKEHKFETVDADPLVPSAGRRRKDTTKLPGSEGTPLLQVESPSTMINNGKDDDYDRV